MTAIQPTQNNHSNLKYYAYGAASLGTGAAIYGLWRHNGDAFLQNGKLTDTFIKHVEENLTEAKDKAFMKDMKWLFDKRKEIDNFKSIDEVVEYIKTNKFLSTNDTKLTADCLKTMKLDQAKDMAKNLLEVTDEKYKQYFTGIFEKAWDKNKEEFIFDSNKISKVQFDSIKSAAKYVNSVKGISLGIIGALVALATCCGINKLCGKSEKP